MRNDKILNQKGLALLTVFFIFLVALIVVGAIAIISVTEIGTTRTNLDAEQAFNLAEAGIDWAKAQFLSGFQLPATPSPYTVTLTNLSGVVVTIAGPTNTPTGSYTVTSSGAIIGPGSTPLARRAIQTTILRTMTSTGDASWLFKRAITANGKIEVKNDTTIRVNPPLPNGDGIAVLSNYVSTKADDYAVKAGDPFMIYPPGYKVGLMAGSTANDKLDGFTQPASQDLVPTLTSTSAQIAAWKAAANEQGHYFTSPPQDWKDNGITLNGGIYFVDVPAGGHLDIDKKLDGQGTLVVNCGKDGKIHTMGGTVWNWTPMALIVIGRAELDLKDTATITGYIYVNGDIDQFKKPITFVGSIAATGKVIFEEENVNITFQNLGAAGPPGFTTTATVPTIVSSAWQEITP